jgi:hypothetical protein
MTHLKIESLEIIISNKQQYLQTEGLVLNQRVLSASLLELN